MDSISQKIKSLREEYPMSKSELARKISVSPAYITMLENGKKDNPSYEILLKISNALECSISDLLGYKYTPEDIALLDGTNEDIVELKKFLELLEYFGYEIRDNGDKYKILKSDKIDLDLPHSEINDFSKKVSEALSDFLEITLKHIIR